jgi:hypothetical protein
MAIRKLNGCRLIAGEGAPEHHEAGAKEKGRFGCETRLLFQAGEL